MPVIKESAASLVAGETLTWEEFERRWDADPELKFAELIGGRVYMPPPLSDPHGEADAAAGGCLFNYVARTPGCKTATSATCRLLRDAPQPDLYLSIRESHGGRSRVRGKYLHGAPELIVEICLSSAEYDLHEKKNLYERAGVDEYVAVLLHEQEVRWFRLEGGKYVLLEPDAKGVFRSIVFPGLWLNAPALFAGDAQALLKTLECGLASAEHAEFVRLLASRRK
ncbi:MAG: Uma2 family endonuclease [Planctomycetota bacterium]